MPYGDMARGVVSPCPNMALYTPRCPSYELTHPSLLHVWACTPSHGLAHPSLHLVWAHTPLAEHCMGCTPLAGVTTSLVWARTPSLPLIWAGILHAGVTSPSYGLTHPSLGSRYPGMGWHNPNWGPQVFIWAYTLPGVTRPWYGLIHPSLHHVRLRHPSLPLVWAGILHAGVTSPSLASPGPRMGWHNPHWGPHVFI